MFYVLNLKKYEKTVQRVGTHSKRIFFKNLRTINWEERGTKVYIKVKYGKDLNVFGKLVDFINEGEYENPDDMWQAVNAFLEDY